MTRLTLCLSLLLTCVNACGQLLEDRPMPFTRADTLRGMLTPIRTCYDVTFYHLDVKIDIDKKFINGSNEIHFNATDDFNRMQIDLFENMQINKIVDDKNRALTFSRELNAVFVQWPETLKKNSSHSMTISYSGNPVTAKNAPWDGGFVWTQDHQGGPWVAVACQGFGASCWWPNKDHQSDEPDSMLISITVPKGLTDISNGRLRRQTDVDKNWTRFDWFVSNPINNYDVTVNIANYAHFNDVLVRGDSLTLDYYVLPDDLEKAQKQFQQVKPMLQCFEKYFGRYPFERDGYKLVEAPYLGMEHQSAVAYGNQFKQGYLGYGLSEIAKSFDYIIIHESAHEWWGNSVTSKDIADMWIHEGFATYAEVLYVQSTQGTAAAAEYLKGMKKAIRNDQPIMGPYGVNREGSADMYNKGAWMLHTLRSVVNDDSLWFGTLRALAMEFKYKTTTTDEVVKFFNKKLGKDFTYFFNQYLKYEKIPTLELQQAANGVQYRWEADVANFNMPVKVAASGEGPQFIYPTTTWQTLKMNNFKKEDFNVALDLFYINVEWK